MADVTSPALDPVCGMTVDPAEAIEVVYGGTAYYFCESACAEVFRDDPLRWVEEGGEPFRHSH